MKKDGLEMVHKDDIYVMRDGVQGFNTPSQACLWE